jgi:hypothetical protein
VGVEGTGLIHGYVLDHRTGAFQRIASFTSGQAGVAGLEFDRDTGYLWLTATIAAVGPRCSSSLSKAASR